MGHVALRQVLSAAIATGFLVWGLKITLGYMDPYREQRREAKRQSTLLRKRLGRNIELNEFEMVGQQQAAAMTARTELLVEADSRHVHLALYD